MSKRTNRTLILSVLGGCLLLAMRVAIAAEDEARLAELLLSPQTPAAQKDAICQQLRKTGSVKCVAAAAALLADPALSQSARLVLENMAGAEAAQALRDALPRTSGVDKAGIVLSLGERRERESVAVLVPLIKDGDPAIASAAALAVGKIGGPQAIEALRAARGDASPALQQTIYDSLLLCADGLLAGGDARAASAIYKEVYDAAKAAQLRAAAYRGLVLSGGDEGLAMVITAINGDDRALLQVAIQLVREMKGEATTKAFAGALAKLKPAVQVAVINALAQRGDSAAAPAVAALAKSEAPEVRRGALVALGTLGDASHAVLLAETAAQAAGADQEAARQSLARLHGAKVCDGLLAALPQASPAVQREIIRAIGQRQEAAAIPTLLKMAEGGDEELSLLALRSLSNLATVEHHQAIAKLLLMTRREGERDAAERALVAACLRAEKPEAAAPYLIECMKKTTAGQDGAPVRAALLRVIGRLGGEQSLVALRAGLAESDAAIQDAALRTMAEYAGAEAAGDLLKFANDQQRNLSQRVQALRGYWRLVGLAGNRPAEERLRMCEAGINAAQRPEEKKLGLGELSKFAHPGALKFAESLCADEAIRGEAEAAVVRIAATMLASSPTEAKAALRRIEKGGHSDAVRSEARKSLGAADQFGGFITTWSAAGPYRQADKKYNELFDIPFDPEKPDAKVEWKPLAPPTDRSLFWQADLLPITGGEQCVVYAASRVFCPSQQKVQLDIGSDDGLKLWINGALVHANNTARPVKAGDDKAEAMLKEGWNLFLVKVTQNNMGCGVCIRIRAADGMPIEGLRFEAGQRP